MEHFELTNIPIHFFSDSNNHSVSYQIINFHKHNNKSAEEQWHHYDKVFLWMLKS